MSVCLAVSLSVVPQVFSVTCTVPGGLFSYLAQIGIAMLRLVAQFSGPRLNMKTVFTRYGDDPQILIMQECELLIMIADLDQHIQGNTVMTTKTAEM